MEFDKSRVYTALNANELKIGSKVIVSDCMLNLRQYVDEDRPAQVLTDIEPDDAVKRFVVDGVTCSWNLAYLVSEPEEKKLEWTDLKIGDVIQNETYTHSMMVIGIDCRKETKSHILIGETWLDDDDLNYWEKVE